MPSRQDISRTVRESSLDTRQITNAGNAVVVGMVPIEDTSKGCRFICCTCPMAVGYAIGATILVTLGAIIGIACTGGFQTHKAYTVFPYPLVK